MFEGRRGHRLPAGSDLCTTAIASGTLSLNYRLLRTTPARQERFVSSLWRGRRRTFSWTAQESFFVLLRAERRWKLAGCTATAAPALVRPRACVQGNNLRMSPTGTPCGYLCNVDSMEVCRVAQHGSHSHLRGIGHQWHHFMRQMRIHRRMTTCSSTGTAACPAATRDRFRVQRHRGRFELCLHWGRGPAPYDVCAIGVSGSLVGCTPTGNGFSAWTAYSPIGQLRLHANQGNGTTRCARSIPMAVFPFASFHFRCLADGCRHQRQPGLRE